MKIKQKKQYSKHPCWAFAVVGEIGGIYDLCEVSYIGVDPMPLKKLVPLLKKKMSLPLNDKYIFVPISSTSLSGEKRLVVMSDLQLLSVPRVGWVWSDTTVGPRLRAGAMAEHEMHENFGPPCKTVSPGCCTCDAWGMFTMGGEVR